MWNEIFVISLAVLLGGLLFWSFRVLPHEGRQIIASVPVVKDELGSWKGLNLTYYGLFVSVAIVVAVAFILLLLGSIDIPIVGTATVVSYANNRIVVDVETPHNGVLWLSELFYPAWRAALDGEETEVLRADYVFRAVEVPAGRHRVVLRFASTYFLWGGLITLLTAAVAGGWFYALCANRSEKGSRSLLFRITTTLANVVRRNQA